MFRPVIESTAVYFTVLCLNSTKNERYGTQAPKPISDKLFLSESASKYCLIFFTSHKRRKSPWVQENWRRKICHIKELNLILSRIKTPCHPCCCFCCCCVLNSEISSINPSVTCCCCIRDYFEFDVFRIMVSCVSLISLTHTKS